MSNNDGTQSEYEKVFEEQRKRRSSVRVNHRTYKEIETDLEQFKKFYSDSTVKEEFKNRCIILQNNAYKIMWDIAVMIIVIAVAIILPIRIAFKDNSGEEFGWVIAYIVIDVIFFVDILLNFFTSYTEQDTHHEETRHN